MHRHPSIGNCVKGYDRSGLLRIEPLRNLIFSFNYEVSGPELFKELLIPGVSQGSPARYSAVEPYINHILYPSHLLAVNLYYESVNVRPMQVLWAELLLYNLELLLIAFR
ncbi:109aa long hypothetical protein [Pyrococcus horikoshii OT3]|uniref:Uncharacterized protein n=1 Tax=Pyrococcus horikoshii (strain ATCC 700860 / DSM 12428 / JCM 9974 / NBRC 100139 / OT-3) TaxID=70601 RepID=O58793_PYRHO|nr:109aa long hypothetical protein [Pyrococcus horikoshii OT3]